MDTVAAFVVSQYRDQVPMQKMRSYRRGTSKNKFRSSSNGRIRRRWERRRRFIISTPLSLLHSILLKQKKFFLELKRKIAVTIWKKKTVGEFWTVFSVFSNFNAIKSNKVPLLFFSSFPRNVKAIIKKKNLQKKFVLYKRIEKIPFLYFLSLNK